ncbi:hypothetical protein PBRA_009674 [Plasmodiophora brassicae]|uniref:Uncharacterized protein n=1 Tax=Plasmodiophora brassicae TaxID=37360 RepID=A0A0G4IK99_PLABS|nr:hypothetical protein PBRA_009674 [Plasmodiophora brassicae]
MRCSLMHRRATLLAGPTCNRPFSRALIVVPRGAEPTPGRPTRELGRGALSARRSLHSVRRAPALHHASTTGGPAKGVASLPDCHRVACSCPAGRPAGQFRPLLLPDMETSATVDDLPPSLPTSA